MKTTRSLRRTFTLSTTALGCLILTACGSVYGPQSRMQLDMDKLLQTSPPASGNALAGNEGKFLRGAVKQDPTSGLRVDIGAATINGTDASAPALNEPAAKPAEAASAATDEQDAKEAAGAPTDPLRPEATVDLSDITANQDLWGRVRQGFGLPALESQLVLDHERWYASRPDYVQRMTERASRYLFHVVDEIQRRQMPTELALLPFIESAFNPQAMSSARASGIWQFMPATGKDFELKQNLFRDDRRDVLASTRAALDYLQRLNKQFGDWHLALAAYNWGEGNVQKAINRNARQGLPTDYASLNMPPETRNYVPKLHAIKNIVAHPEAYNLTLTPIENHPYFVSVPIQRDLDATLAARLAGLPLDEFKALNPSLNKPVILAAGTPQVLLPYDNAGLFVHNLSNHKGPLASWTAWVVPRTMRPGDAARQVGMSEGSLRDINHIPPKMLVKAGSTLLVPRSVQREQDVSEALADNAMMALAPDLPPMRRMSLKAGKRDTVAGIARRYRVSPQQVAQWNRVSASATFQRGQTVVVYVPTGKTNARRVATVRNNVANAKGRAPTRVVASAARSPARNSAAKARPSVNRNARVRVASAR
ncbi:MAG TPA: transglycosylase SLT domain-containing protein [Aquabacterium sp.]|uniref:transglycosylase SLT domain-containing protein n=1 Tax=Aquabacterium sp. TaxID=1872578 RepID=UPI002E36B11B|nr:transglycosylase SLT domain-containing protein [Aquabacterium sp.]HEX5354783.1 transglycosylase SLT domain-containing protein [Aquabacterium sp.]